jgi:hypothetical protein
MGVPDEQLTPAEQQVERLLAEMSRAADSIEWSLDLDDRRTRARPSGRFTRRGVVVVLIAAAVVVLLVVPLPRLHLFHSTPRPPRPVTHGSSPRPHHRFVVSVAPGEGVQFLAAHGPLLYVATDYAGNPPYGLSAYDTTTGRLVGQVAVPAMPAALAVGPAGNVWITFYPDQNGGPTATWLLTPDLSKRSSAHGVAPTAIVPIGSYTAQVVTQYGLELLRMPPPGAGGHSSIHREPHTSVGPPLNTAPNVAVLFDGHVVAQVTNGYGLHSHLVEAGRPGLTFGGSTAQQAGLPAVAGAHLWDPTFASGSQAGPLVELDSQFRVVTPTWVRDDRLLRSTESIWGEGGILWAATAVPGHGLVCFAVGGGQATVATVVARGEPADLAVVGATVYLAEQLSVADTTGDVVGYKVPSACR